MADRLDHALLDEPLARHRDGLGAHPEPVGDLGDLDTGIGQVGTGGFADDLAAQLAGQTFETSLGPVSFDAGRYWTGEPYGLYVSQSGDFVPLTEDRQ